MEVNTKPFTSRECRVFIHSETGKFVPPPPIVGGEQHHREWLADVGLERSEILPHRMVALTERNQILKPV